MLMPLVALLMACSSDSYDTGDGSLSYMVADLLRPRPTRRQRW